MVDINDSMADDLPKYKARVNASYKLDKVTVTAAVNYLHSMGLPRYNTLTGVRDTCNPSYAASANQMAALGGDCRVASLTTLDLGMGVQLTKGLNVRATVLNVFDKKAPYSPTFRPVWLGQRSAQRCGAEPFSERELQLQVNRPSIDLSISPERGCRPRRFQGRCAGSRPFFHVVEGLEPWTLHFKTRSCFSRFAAGWPWAALAPAAARPLLPPPGLQADGLPSLATGAAHAGPGSAEAPVLRFLGWHPQRREMLVLAQRRRQPAAAPPEPSPARARRLLTGGRERVDSAQWEPQRGEYLVFSRDRGGDEAFRLYRLQPLDAIRGERGERTQPRRTSGADARRAHASAPSSSCRKGEGLGLFVLDQLDGRRSPADESECPPTPKAGDEEADSATTSPSGAARSALRQPAAAAPAASCFGWTRCGPRARACSATASVAATPICASAPAGTVVALHTRTGAQPDPALRSGSRRPAMGGQALGSRSMAAPSCAKTMLLCGSARLWVATFRQLVLLQLEQRPAPDGEACPPWPAIWKPWFRAAGRAAPCLWPWCTTRPGVSVLRLARSGQRAAAAARWRPSCRPA